MKFRLSTHALEEMRRRGIPLDILEAVLNNPQQIVPQREGRRAYQSQVDFDGQIFLLRAIVADNIEPPVVGLPYHPNC
jgi:hypothetical protein